jgi:hypothetical protein
LEKEQELRRLLRNLPQLIGFHAGIVLLLQMPFAIGITRRRLQNGALPVAGALD